MRHSHQDLHPSLPSGPTKPYPREEDAGAAGQDVNSASTATSSGNAPFYNNNNSDRNVPYQYVDTSYGYPYQYYYYDEASLKETVRKQVEYYFSKDNLARDVYLRRHLDNECYARLEFIASFNRLAQLTQDVRLIADSLINR